MAVRENSQTRGAVIVCGGESRRMGRDKASLPFGADGSLLSRILTTLRKVVAEEDVVVVASAGQKLANLPAGVIVLRDAAPRQGPLPAVAAGLAQLASRRCSAFVCGCDTPFLQHELVLAVLERLNHPPQGADPRIVIPRSREGWHPLAAAYATQAASRLEELVTLGERSLSRACHAAGLDVVGVGIEELSAAAGSDLAPSLINCNTPEDYARAFGVAP